VGFRNSFKRLSRRLRSPGKKKYRKTVGAVKGVINNPSDAGQRAEAAARLSAAPLGGSQYV
jgi:hypothetical protein